MYERFNNLKKEFYVYIYLNPLKPGNFTYTLNKTKYNFDYEPLYVGKGKGDRFSRHLYKCTNEDTNKTYNENYLKHIIARKLGITENHRQHLKSILGFFIPYILPLGEFDDEHETYEFEFNVTKTIGARFDKTGPLTNMKYGGNSKFSSSIYDGVLLFDVLKRKPKWVKSATHFDKKYKTKIRGLFDGISTITGNRFCKYEDRDKFSKLKHYIYMYDQQKHKIHRTKIHDFVKTYNESCETTGNKEIYYRSINNIFLGKEIEQVGDLFISKNLARTHHQYIKIYDIDYNEYLVSNRTKAEFGKIHNIDVKSLNQFFYGSSKWTGKFFIDYEDVVKNNKIHRIYSESGVYEFRLHDYMEFCDTHGFNKASTYAVLCGNNESNLIDGLFKTPEMLNEYIKEYKFYSDITNKHYIVSRKNMGSFINGYNNEVSSDMCIERPTINSLLSGRYLKRKGIHLVKETI